MPYYYSEQYYGYYGPTSYVERLTADTTTYPATYPSDRGGAAESAREDPSGGTEDKAMAIVVNQKSEIDRFPASQKYQNPSSADTYITQDWCCDAALANDDLPLDDSQCLTDDDCTYPDADLYGLPGIGDVAGEEMCSAIEPVDAALCSAVENDGTAFPCESAGRCTTPGATTEADCNAAFGQWSTAARCAYRPACRWHKYHSGTAPAMCTTHQNILTEDACTAESGTWSTDPFPAAPIPFSMSHKFCTKLVPTLENTCDLGTDGTGGSFESDILSQVYHVQANPVTFDPPAHSQSLFSEGQCVELTTYNPLYSASGNARGHEDIYYIVGRPDQRFDLLGISPGVYSRDSFLPTTCAQAILDGTEAKCLAAGACTYVPATADEPERCEDRPWATEVNPELTKYTGCIPLTESSSIAAVAIGDGFAPSKVVVATYWVQIDQPEVTVFASGGATAAEDQLTPADTLAPDPVGLTNTFYSYVDITIDAVVQSTNAAQPVPDLVPVVYLAVAHQDPERACPECFSCDIGCPLAVRSSMANMVSTLKNRCQYKEADYCSGCNSGDRLLTGQGFDCNALTSQGACEADGGTWNTFDTRDAFWADTCADPTSGNSDATDNFGYSSYRQVCVDKMADFVDWLEDGFVTAAGDQAESCLRYFDLNYPTVHQYVETCAAYKPDILNAASATALWRSRRGRERSCDWLRYDATNKPRIDASSTLYVFSQKKDSSGTDLLLPSAIKSINYDIKVDEVKMLPCGVPTSTSQLYQGPQTVRLSTTTTSYPNSITATTSGEVEFRYFFDDTFYDTSTSSLAKRDDNGNMMRNILRSFAGADGVGSADPESKTGDKLNPYVSSAYDRCYDVPGVGDGSMDREAAQSCVAVDQDACTAVIQADYVDGDAFAAACTGAGACSVNPSGDCEATDAAACEGVEMGKFTVSQPSFPATCTGTSTSGDACILDAETNDITLACPEDCTLTYYDPAQPQKDCEAAGACLYSQPRIPCISNSKNPDGSDNPVPAEYIERRDNRGTFFGASRVMTTAELGAASSASGQAYGVFKACADDNSYTCSGCLTNDCSTIGSADECAAASGSWDCDHCGSCSSGDCGNLKTRAACELDGGTWFYPYVIQNSGKLYVYATKEGSIDSEVSTCETVVQVRPPTWFQSGQMCIDIAGDGATKCEVPAFLGSGFVVLTPAAGDDSDETHIYFKYKANMEADPLTPAVCFDPTEGEFCSPIDPSSDDDCASAQGRDDCIAKPLCQYNTGGFVCDACDPTLPAVGALTDVDRNPVTSCDQIKSVDDCDKASGRWTPNPTQGTGLDTCVTRSVDVCQRALGHCEACGSGARRIEGSGYDCDALNKEQCLQDRCMAGRGQVGNDLITTQADCEATGECTRCVKDGVSAQECLEGIGGIRPTKDQCEGPDYLGTWSAKWIVCVQCNAVTAAECLSYANKEECELQGDGIWMGPEWVTVQDSIGYGTCEPVTTTLATCVPTVSTADCPADSDLGCAAVADNACISDAAAGTCTPPVSQAVCAAFKLTTGVDGDPTDCPVQSGCTYTASEPLDDAIVAANRDVCADVVNDRNEATCTGAGSSGDARSIEVGERTPAGFFLGAASGEYWGERCKYTPDTTGDGSLATESEKVCEVDMSGDQSGLDAKVADRYAGDHCEDCRSQARLLPGYGFDCDAIKTKARCLHDGGTWISVESGVCTYNPNGVATCTGILEGGVACAFDAVTGGCPAGCRYNSGTEAQCMPMPAESWSEWQTNQAACEAVAQAALAAGTSINEQTCIATEKCLFLPAATCTPTDFDRCSAQTDEQSCDSVGNGEPGVGDCLWAGNGDISNQAVCEGTYSGLAPQGRWTGGIDIAMVRQQDKDGADGNQLTVRQSVPGTKFEQWIQFNAGENIYFSMKARATKPWQVTSQELVQTFVIAKLLSQRATVSVEPETALDQTCTGCKLENILVSSSGMFWNSVADVEKVAITLSLPSVFLSDICKMAYCKSTSTICGSSGVECNGVELQAVCKLSQRPVWEPASSTTEYCGVVQCDGYVPGTTGNPSITCPSDCTLAGTAGIDETCTPTVTDCSTNYAPGTAAAPSTTCPSGCDFIQAVATPATCTAPSGAVLAAVTTEIDCLYPTQSNCATAGGTWRVGDGIDQMTCTGANSFWTPSDECGDGDVEVFHADVRENSDGDATPAAEATCQLYQLLFWNIRYPFVPQQSKPWKRAGSACTNYRMKAYGRVRTQCVDGTNTPVALSSSTWLGDVADSCQVLDTAPTWTAAVTEVLESCEDNGGNQGDCSLTPGVDCSDQTVAGAHQAADATCTGVANCAVSADGSCPVGCDYTDAVVGSPASCTGTQTDGGADCATSAAWTTGTGVAGDCATGCDFVDVVAPASATCTGTADAQYCTSLAIVDTDGTACGAAGCTYLAAVEAGSCTYTAPVAPADATCTAADGTAVVDDNGNTPSTQAKCESPEDSASCDSAGGSWKPCLAAGDVYMSSDSEAACLADGAVYDDACTDKTDGICSVTAARDACKAAGYTWIGEDCTGGPNCDAVSLATPESRANTPQDWTDAGATDQEMCRAATASGGTGCTYTEGSEPRYTQAQAYAPQFSDGAGVFDEDADAFRPDDLWTPKNPVTVTSLQYECLTPPLFVDYWSVFGIPRAPRNLPANLDATKCDDGERTDGSQRPAKCGARARPGSTVCPEGQSINRYGDCSYTSKLGDGVCDREFNHAIFLYDELDCFYSAMEEISGAEMSFAGGI